MIFLAFAEGGGLLQLVPDGTIVIHIALILLMIWVLNRTFFKPINKVLAARERRQGGRSGEAQEILKQIGEKNAKYDTTIREARAEGYQKLETERATALANREAQIEKVKEEVSQMVSSEKASIQKQSEAARATLAADAQTLAEKISSTILKA